MGFNYLGLVEYGVAQLFLCKLLQSRRVFQPEGKILVTYITKNPIRDIITAAIDVKK